MNNYSRIFFIILVFFASSQVSSQQTMVEVDRIIETNLNQTVPIIGTIISNKKSNLMAPLPGKIDSILFEEGDFVSKGKLITRIDYEKYKWLYEKAKAIVKIHEVEYNNSKTETKINLSDLNRMKALKNSSAFNEANYEKLTNLHEINQSNETKALAKLESAKYDMNMALLDFKNSQVRAPYDGILEERFIEDKEVVTIGTKMFNIVSKKYLEVLAEIPTLRVTNLSIGNTITAITVDNFKILASIRAIGAEENSKTRTVKVYLSFNKSEELRNLFAGENITLQVPIGEGKKALTIHKDAILKREGISLAYVVKDNKVEIRPLKLGEAVNNRFIVYNGVSLNELSVIKGNERLRPGQAVKLKEKQ
tara:strand:- start:1357 stop:2451 length:1095 start_codon:yes stop_codon:yes gene_type:complete